MSRVCAKVNFTRDIASKCVVDTSIERWENGEHIQGVEFVFLLAFAVKTSRWYYFWSHPRMCWFYQIIINQLIYKIACAKIDDCDWKPQPRKGTWSWRVLVEGIFLSETFKNQNNTAYCTLWKHTRNNASRFYIHVNVHRRQEQVLQPQKRATFLGFANRVKMTIYYAQ